MKKSKKNTVVAVANVVIVGAMTALIVGLKLTGIVESAVFVVGLGCMGGTVYWLQKK